MDHTITIPDDLYARLAAYAARQGKTPDEVLVALATEAIEQGHEDEHELSPDDPLMRLAGLIQVPVEQGWADRHDEHFVFG